MKAKKSLKYVALGAALILTLIVCCSRSTGSSRFYQDSPRRVCIPTVGCSHLRSKATAKRSWYRSPR